MMCFKGSVSEIHSQWPIAEFLRVIPASSYSYEVLRIGEWEGQSLFTCLCCLPLPSSAVARLGHEDLASGFMICNRQVSSIVDGSGFGAARHGVLRP